MASSHALFTALRAVMKPLGISAVDSGVYLGHDVDSEVARFGRPAQRARMASLSQRMRLLQSLGNMGMASARVYKAGLRASARYGSRVFGLAPKHEEKVVAPRPAPAPVPPGAGLPSLCAP